MRTLFRKYAKERIFETAMLSYNKFKLKFQRYAIPNLATYVSICFAVGYLILYLAPALFIDFLVFAPAEVLHGQIWRIATTILYPPSGGSLFWTVLAIYVYYSMGTTLERWWGSFNFNVYFFSSILVSELGLIIFYLITGWNLPLVPIYMYFSIFMAYAITFPEAQFLLFFVLPVKAKYLAVAEAVIYIYNFLTGGMLSRVYILCAMIPVAVYFFISLRGGRSGGLFESIKQDIKRKKRQKEWRDQWR